LKTIPTSLDVERIAAAEMATSFIREKRKQMVVEE
jgi:hypothetical protein